MRIRVYNEENLGNRGIISQSAEKLFEPAQFSFETKPFLFGVLIHQSAAAKFRFELLVIFDSFRENFDIGYETAQPAHVDVRQVEFFGERGNSVGRLRLHVSISSTGGTTRRSVRCPISASAISSTGVR